jgi:hypothetical protein
MRLLPIAALVTAATVATGCASTVNGTPHGGGTTAAGHSSAAAATSAVPTPTETAAPTPTPTASSAGRLDSLLITAADIKDPSFQETQYTESTEPAPCTPKAKGTLDQQVPPEQRAGRDLARTADPQALVEEQLKVYDTTITASKALAFAKAGLGCAKGVTYNSDGSTSPITIHGPRDVTGALPSGVDEAYDWTLQSSDLQAEAVAARIGDVLVLLEFATVANADVSKLPDTGSIAARAVQKVIDGH